MARSSIVRQAADLLGTNPLADALGVSRRSLAYWQEEEGARGAPDGVMRELLPLLDAHIDRVRQLRRDVFAEICATERTDGQG